jgi:hypothetical protein
MSKTTDTALARRRARAREVHLKSLLLAGFSITKATLYRRQTSKTFTLKLAKILDMSAPDPPLFFLAMLQNLHGVPNQHTPMRPDRSQRSMVSCTAVSEQSHQSLRSSSIGAATRRPFSRQAPDSLAHPAKTSRKTFPFLNVERRTAFWGAGRGGDGGCGLRGNALGARSRAGVTAGRRSAGGVSGLATAGISILSAEHVSISVCTCNSKPGGGQKTGTSLGSCESV